MKTEFQLIQHYGPSIFKVKIPKDILDKLNNYIDEITANKKKSLELDYGNSLAGQVTQEFKLEKDFSKKIGWLDFLAQCSAKWIELTTKKKNN